MKTIPPIEAPTATPITALWDRPLLLFTAVAVEEPLGEVEEGMLVLVCWD